MKKLQREMYEIAVEHGWWENDTLNIGEKIALMHSELSEALEHYRNGNQGYPLPQVYFLDSKEKNIDSLKPDGFAIELADCVIRIMDLCEHLGIDLEDAIKIKAEYNKSRPYKHGGKKI